MLPGKAKNTLPMMHIDLFPLKQESKRGTGSVTSEEFINLSPSHGEVCYYMLTKLPPSHDSHQSSPPPYLVATTPHLFNRIILEVNVGGQVACRVWHQ